MNAKATAFWAKLALFSAALIWGSSFFMVKNTVDAIPPNFLLAIRFTAACLILSVVFYKKWRQFTWDYLLRGAIIGLCLFLAYCSQTIGITDTTPGKNAFLTAIYCVIVPFLFWAVDHRKPDLYQFAAAVLCIGGIGLVSLDRSFSIRMGDALTLLGGFFYAAHMVAVAKVCQNRDPILITILQFGFAGLFSWIVALLFEPLPSALPDWETLGSIGYLAVFCTAGALLLQNIGQAHTHPAPAAILLSLESVFGVFFSVLIYHEELTGQLILGFLLIFIAVLVSETKLSFLKKGPQKNASSQEVSLQQTRSEQKGGISK